MPLLKPEMNQPSSEAFENMPAVLVILYNNSIE
jgi:hypothetical protein